MRNQQVRFCRSFDDASIAYAVSGEGPPVVMLPNWLTHLEYQWRSVAWRPWLEALSARYRLIRYDPRGCGLSDRDVSDLSFHTWVRDLEAVVDAAGAERFSLVGVCQGGPVALEFVGQHADRVERLVLYGTYARGRNRRSTAPLEPQKAKVMLEMMELGWSRRTMPSCARSPRSSSPKARWSTCAPGASCSAPPPRRRMPWRSPASCSTSTCRTRRRACAVRR
jgi:pimeloyl-ACP methyl ester carboxylesterase